MGLSDLFGGGSGPLNAGRVEATLAYRHDTRGLDDWDRRVGKARVDSKRSIDQRVGLDTSEYDRRIAGMRAELAQISAMKADPEADLDVASFNARAKILRAEIARLNAMKATIRIDSRDADLLKNRIDSLIPKVGRGTITIGLLGGAGLAAAKGLAALVGGAVSVTSALAPMTGAAVAVPALFGAIGQAAGVVGLAGMKDFTEALGGNEEALKRLTPEARQFLEELEALEPRYRRLQTTAQEPLFAGLDRGLDHAIDNFPILNRIIDDTSHTIGRFIVDAGQMLGDREFGEDLLGISDQNNRTLDQMGDATLNIASALRHVLIAGGPFIDWMGRNVVELSEFVEAEAEAGRESGRLADFFEESRQSLHRFWDIGEATVGTLLNLGRASKPFGEEFLVDIRDGADELERLTGSVEGQNKLREYFKDSSETLHELSNDIADILDEGSVSDAVARAITLAVPIVAENAGELGLAVLRGLARGFAEGGALERLFVAGAFIRLVGGTGALRSIGVRMAAWIAAPMATTIAAETAAGTAGGVAAAKWKGAGRIAGRLMGAGVLLALPLIIPEAYNFGKKIGREFKEGFDSIFDAIGGDRKVPALQQALAGIEDLREGAAAIARIKMPWDEKTAALAQQFGVNTTKAAQALDKATHTAQGADSIFGQLRGSLDGLASQGSKDLDKVGDSAQKNVGKRVPSEVRAAERALNIAERATDSFRSKATKDFDKTGDATRDLGKRGARNFDGLRQLVDNLSGAWSRGLDLIGGNTKSLLDKLKVQFDYKIDKGGKSSPIDKGAAFFQSGGILSGYSRTDDRLIAVRGGEAILRPEDHVPTIDASLRQTHGVGLKDYLRRTGGKVGGYASGGVVGGGLDFALGPYDIPPIQYAADHAGGNSHVHITGTTTPWVVALGKRLQQMGFMVGEHPAFGGVNAQHSATGGHYDALAIDVNSAADETRAEVAQIAQMLGGSFGGAAALEKIKRVLMEGPAGPLLEGGNAGLEMVRRAANKFISKRQVSSVPDPGGSGALSEGEFLGLANRAIGITDRSGIWGGADGFSAQGLLTLAKAESSLIPSSINDWDINAQMGNPSGGLMHLTQSNMRTYAEPGLGSDMFDPLASIAASINYQIDTYGGQVTHSPYRLGGIVPGFKDGGLVGTINDLFGKLGKVGSDKREGRIEKEIDRLTRKLNRKQKSKRKKKLDLIDQQGAMKGARSEIAAGQKDVNFIGDFIGGLEIGHGFTTPREVDDILATLPNLDPEADSSSLYLLNDEQRGMLTAALEEDYRVEASEVYTEGVWNQKLLQALVDLRAKMLSGLKQAEEQIRKAEEQIVKAEREKKKAEDEADDIEKRIKKLQKDLADLRAKEPPKRRKGEKPKDYNERVRSWREQHGANIDSVGDRIAKQRFGLTQANREASYLGQVITTARENKGELGEFTDETLLDLESVQGPGRSMDPKQAINPGDVWTFGGQIRDVQAQLVNLGMEIPVKPNPDFTAPSDDTGTDAGTDTTQDQIRDLLEEIRRGQRTSEVVSLEQSGIFDALERSGRAMAAGLPTFHTGGILPGTTGQERPYMGLPGEGVFTPEQMAAMGPGGNIYIVLDDPTLAALNPQIRAVTREELGALGQRAGVRRLTVGAAGVDSARAAA